LRQVASFDRSPEVTAAGRLAHSPRPRRMTTLRKSVVAERGAHSDFGDRSSPVDRRRLRAGCRESYAWRVCAGIWGLLDRIRPELSQHVKRQEHLGCPQPACQALQLSSDIQKSCRRTFRAERPISIGSGDVPTIQDTSSFAGPREFAAFLGLTPKQSSSGGKQRLGS